MPLEYGTSFEPLTGREEPWAQLDGINYQGNEYVIRMTALAPYKDYAQGSDALRCHIDFLNITQGISGRYEDTEIPGRDFQEPDGHMRRWSAIRHLQFLVDNVTPIASPVFP